MNLRHLIILSISICVVCFPVPEPCNDGNHIEKRAVHPGIKAGLGVTLSITGLLGASIGLIEYVTTVYNRFHEQTIGHQNKLKEIEFRRERVLADNDFRNAGNDIVLDLIEKYVDCKDGKRGGKRKLIVEGRNTRNETHEEIDNVTNAREDPPLPRYPGFPLLSKGRAIPPPMYALVERIPGNGLIKEDVKTETEPSVFNEDHRENHGGEFDSIRLKLRAK